MILSDAFKNDTLGKNTQLIPLVIIEKFISQEAGLAPLGGEIHYKREFLSTHNIQVGENYFKPLLLDVPTLSQKADLINGKFQVASLKLKISNIDYNNSGRLSEVLDSYSLMNAVVCLHYKSQSCTKIQLPNQHPYGVTEDTNTSIGCPRVFVGVIRDITHQEDTITLSIEDSTEQKITRNLPNNRLGSTDNVPDKYKNEYIPMLYGKMENAPTVAEYVAGSFTIKADSSPINKINHKEWGSDNYNYGGVSLYEDGQYLGVTKYVHWQAFQKSEETASERFYKPRPSNALQYTTDDFNHVSFREKSMLNVVNRIEVLRSGKPQNIILMQNNGQEDGKGLDIEFDFNVFEPVMIFNEEYDIQHLNGNDHQIATDGLSSTSFQKTLSNYSYWSNEGGGVSSNAISFNVFFSLQWDSGISSADYIRVIDNRINNVKIPVKGDKNLPSNYGEWDNVFNEIWIYPNAAGRVLIDNQSEDGTADTNDYGLSINRDSTFSLYNLDLDGLISLGNDYTWTNILNNYSDIGLGETFDMPYNEDADIKVTSVINLEYTTDGVIFNSPNKLPFIRLGSGGTGGTDINAGVTNSGAMPDAGIGWSSLEVLGHVRTDGTQNNTLGLGFTAPVGGWLSYNLDITLKEIEVTTLAQFNEARESDFYLNAEGRTDTFLKDYEHFWLWDLENEAGDFAEMPIETPEIIENPVDIIRHIMVEECGLTHDDFDEDEFNLAWGLRQQGGQPFTSNPIKLAISINKLTNSKGILQKISQNSMVFPRFKNNGKMGFVALQKGYYPQYGYNSANEIDINDIIKYKFDLSKDLVSKVDVSYNHSYAKGKNLNTTDSIEMSEVELNWNGIKNVEDSYLNYQADYINDEASAIMLRDMIWYDRKAKHLQIELTLPLSYLDVAIGDLCKFPNELIDGIKAHGINYTVFDNYGGILRVPLFQVIHVSKNLNNIKIRLHQLHWLDEPIFTDADESLWDSVDLDNDMIDPMLEGVDEADDFEPYEPSIFTFTEFLIGNDSSFMQNETQFQSSYSREFIITDTAIGTEYYPNYPLSFNLKDNFNMLFGLGRFDISSWLNLIPSINSDGYGYGIITNGNGYNSVGGFIGMEIRMTNGNGISDRVLSLRNIAGTEFDSDVYDPLTTIIPDNITPSTTELKLGWVFYYCDNNWNYTSINGSGNYVIDDNLNYTIHPTISGGDIIQNSNTFNYNMVLYPYYNPVQDMTLTYSTALESSLLISPDSSNKLGDFNLDGSVNILDLVVMMQYIMENISANDQQILNADVNSDGIVDILDLVSLVNIILDNQ